METIIPMAIVIGLTQVVKKLGLPKKFLPAFAVVLGVGISMLTDGTTTTAILTGIVIGLSSMGLYSAGKTVIA